MDTRRFSDSCHNEMTRASKWKQQPSQSEQRQMLLQDFLPRSLSLLGRNDDEEVEEPGYPLCSVCAVHTDEHWNEFAEAFLTEYWKNHITECPQNGFGSHGLAFPRR
jgi:hypothetical protein